MAIVSRRRGNRSAICRRVSGEKKFRCSPYHYGVYDDFPEIEKYQFKSLVILEICKLVQDQEFDSRDKIYKLLPDFYWNNVNHAINTVKEFDITPEFFKARFEEFIKLVDKKKQILYLGAALWKKYLPKINNQNYKIKPLPKIIQV